METNMANAYESMTTEELDAAIAQLEADVERLRAKGLMLPKLRPRAWTRALPRG